MLLCFSDDVVFVIALDNNVWMFISKKKMKAKLAGANYGVVFVRSTRNYFICTGARTIERRNKIMCCYFFVF
jgi:hypothetical protein